MSSRKLKTGFFVLEGLNSFATVYYCYYLFFFMQEVFGFGNKANLTLAAFSGMVCMVSAWWAGRFAQRSGYFTALKLGFAIMSGALATAAWLHSAPGQIVAMAVMVFGMCFTWPTLEALVSEGETSDSLRHIVGIYNVVWAATAALANFTGGAMLEKLGRKSLFYVPMCIQLTQLGITFWLESRARRQAPDAAGHQVLETRLVEDPPSAMPELNPRPIARTKTFLRMAWLANPFAYIAINTLIAVVPGVASRLGLSTMLAGFCCSVWCFARLGAFVALWFWNGWHYRFHWLLAAYLTLAGSFAFILLAPNLAVLVVAQILFGGAIGLIYYSSLFYSMDVGETKGEHGGIHEAAIGLGNFAGPAMGAVSLYLWPHQANGSALAVSGLLILGLAGLLAIRRLGR
jgi:predicted MFS family arabinose efflux permease